MTAENQSTGSTEATQKKPRKKAEKKSLLTVINDFLASVTLAISLLIALATTSIIGTIVLQKGQPEQYLSEYGPGVYKFFKFLALDDMYRSWWFLTLLVLLMMNITLCSIRRIPRAWQLMTRSPTLLDDGLFRRMKQRGSVRRGVKPDEAVERAGEVLSKHFGKFREDQDSESVTLYVNKGGYGRMGAYIVHLSILLLAVGAIYGGIMGFKGFVGIVEGQTIDRVPIRGKNAVIQLPFSVRNDDFQVVYYPGTQQPKDYYSDLVVIRNGKEVARKRIEVNHPLIIDGIYFYQSSYGVDQNSTVTLDVLDPSGKIAAPPVTAPVGRGFNVLGDSSTYGIKEIYPSYMGGQPAVVMTQVMGSGRRDFLLTKSAPDRDKQRGGPVYFRISDTDIREYTGLQVAWDPGVPMVWIACTVMMIGLYIAFFVGHRRVWIRVDSDPENTAVLIAGTTNRNPASFEKDFEAALGDLKDALKRR